MNELRKYYLAAAVFLSIGAILAAVKSEPIALTIFVILAAMMVWIAFRVDRLAENARPSDRNAGQADRNDRPSDRPRAKRTK